MFFTRDDRQQFFVAAIRIVTRVNVGRHLPDVGRQVAEEGSNHVERFIFALGEIIDHAGTVDLAAFIAEVLFGDLDSQRGFDNRRTAGKNLTHPLTITLKWAKHASTAGSPATLPSAAATTGAMLSIFSIPGVAGLVGI